MKLSPRSADTLILAFLSGRTHATAPAIQATCSMPPGELRARLAALQTRRLIVSRQDASARPPRRLFSVTPEGRRASGIGGAGATTGA